MVVELNLLPKDKVVDKSALKTAALLQKLAIGLTVVFLIITVVGGGIYFLMSQRLNSLLADEAKYTTNIQSLQNTEASLILLKDRIAKAQSILDSRTTEAMLAKQQNILAFESPDIQFESSEVDSAQATVEISSTQSSVLGAFVNTMLAQGGLTSLLIEEFAFLPNQGYQAKFMMQ